jgi:hypothetical protein
MMTMKMILLKKYCNNVTFFGLIMIFILFHSYTASDLIVDSFNNSNTNSNDEIDEMIWNHNNNYDDDIF